MQRLAAHDACNFGLKADEVDFFNFPPRDMACPARI